jgi:hypothetical protein
MEDRGHLRSKPRRAGAISTGAGAATDPTLPAFLARPAGAPVYHGFRVLTDIVEDGFTLGVISGYDDGDSDGGDAFVIAPDDARAGLVWDVGAALTVELISEAEPERFGVFAVTFTEPMVDAAAARRNLAAIAPALRAQWRRWHAEGFAPGDA